MTSKMMSSFQEIVFNTLLYHIVTFRFPRIHSTTEVFDRLKVKGFFPLFSLFVVFGFASLPVCSCSHSMISVDRRVPE